MNRLEMQRMWEKELASLSNLNLPNSLEWAEKNLPQAREYIEKVYSDVIKSIVLEKGQNFKMGMERYVKAWIRLWEHMALEHCKGKDVLDIDFRYYQHLPQGHSMVWDSEKLGFKFRVFSKKPPKPPEDMPWITASEMIDIHENPILFDMIKELGAWFDRNRKKRLGNLIERAKRDCKGIEPKLKVYRKDKHGFEWYK